MGEATSDHLATAGLQHRCHHRKHMGPSVISRLAGLGQTVHRVNTSERRCTLWCGLTEQGELIAG